jgi:hypothetical protein
VRAVGVCQQHCDSRRAPSVAADEGEASTVGRPGEAVGIVQHIILEDVLGATIRVNDPDGGGAGRAPEVRDRSPAGRPLRHLVAGSGAVDDAAATAVVADYDQLGGIREGPVQREGEAIPARRPLRTSAEPAAQTCDHALLSRAKAHRPESAVRNIRELSTVARPGGFALDEDGQAAPTAGLGIEGSELSAAFDRDPAFRAVRAGRALGAACEHEDRHSRSKECGQFGKRGSWLHRR